MMGGGATEKIPSQQGNAKENPVYTSASNTWFCLRRKEHSIVKRKDSFSTSLNCPNEHSFNPSYTYNEYHSMTPYIILINKIITR